MGEAAALIDALGLARHPEGGWYKETWRADAAEGERASATAILFLLEAGERSHWHTVDSAELWFWHQGAPLALLRADGDGGAIETITLGPDVAAGQSLQGLIPTGWWQAAEARDGWVLVSCVVSPGFEFAGFTLAPPGWAPEA
ncbi:cupin domain-containing protein [Sphingomonas sp. BIUV-7]|uniref:Cupin domain-containing protein n=1 Tax=Sphingomonas natans TaxID=3063330 RepID=A0ABT8YBG5_9SPHN|nr:cupin domain-containing protein [Sphingomonas sp. BIUV-7]MDO6415681.1 cupin domain-containing protein [Sphingomonas sp. BIUV-7]